MINEYDTCRWCVPTMLWLLQRNAKTDYGQNERADDLVPVWFFFVKLNESTGKIERKKGEINYQL